MYLQTQVELTEWHHKFWLEVNEQFEGEKQRFTAHFGEKGPSADQLAAFYQDFLNRNRVRHRDYNREWWGRNFKLLPIALRAWTSTLFKR